jgi:hypothetical protein
MSNIPLIIASLVVVASVLLAMAYAAMDDHDDDSFF